MKGSGYILTIVAVASVAFMLAVMLVPGMGFAFTARTDSAGNNTNINMTMTMDSEIVAYFTPVQYMDKSGDGYYYPYTIVNSELVETADFTINGTIKLKYEGARADLAFTTTLKEIEAWIVIDRITITIDGTTYDCYSSYSDVPVTNSVVEDIVIDKGEEATKVISFTIWVLFKQRIPFDPNVLMGEVSPKFVFYLEHEHQS